MTVKDTEALWAAIGRFRREYADETGIPISIAGIPLLTYQSVEDGIQMSVLEQERSDQYGGPGPAYGRSLSARMVRLAEGGYGTTFLTRRVLVHVPRWCESRHREKGDPLHQARPLLCYGLTRTAVTSALGSGEFVLPERQRISFYERIVRKAATDADIEAFDAAVLIQAAMRFMDDKRDQILARIAA